MTVSIKNLQFQYKANTKPTLSIPDWQIQTGASVFLYGPSGHGKSTLLNILAGILPCKQAEIEIGGQRLDKMSARQRDRFRARHIGYVFQQFNLINDLNIIDNIKLAADVAHKKVSRHDISMLLTALQIPESVWQHPAAQLSIGQQQRVAIARALIKQPEFLLVDEPTSSLDKNNRDSFMQLLMRHCEDRKVTLLFVSHDESLQRFLDHSVSLESLNQV